MKQNTTAAKVQGTETAKTTATNLTVAHKATDSKTEKTEPQKTELKAQPRIGTAKTVKEIIEKNFRLVNLIEQHEGLNQTAKKLDSFHLGSDKMVDSLSIRDGKGNEFKTNNTAIISKVVEMVKGEVETKTNEVESQIQFLEAA